MNAEQAKEILQNYRPRVDDADAQFAEALAQAKRDPVLAAWLNEHAAQFEALRHKFRQTPIPADLRDRILGRQPTRATVPWWKRPAFVTAAVAVAILVNVISYFTFWASKPAVPTNTLTAYLQMTTGWAASGYKMDIKTEDAGELKRVFASRGSPTDYVVAPGLAALHLEGGVVLGWAGHKVSVLCYEKDGEESRDAWLFVTDRDSILDVPATETRQFATVNGLVTATWTHGDKTYVLATRGSQADLEKLF